MSEQKYFETVNEDFNSESSKAMLDIIKANDYLLHKHLNNPKTNFDKISPPNLIILIVTNILLSLFITALKTQDLAIRLKCGDALINEIGIRFLDLLQKMEVSKANVESKN